MRSTITMRGQTVIPAEIRRQFQLSPADRLEWVIDREGIRCASVRAYPIGGFRGRGIGGATKRQLRDRKEEAGKE